MSDYNALTLSEHESAPKDDPSIGANYQPTDDEKKTIKRVNKLFSKAKKARQEYDQHWIEYYKMFRGQQWSESRPTYRHSEVVNLIFQNIQHMVPILTDIKPSISFLPQDPSDFELSEMLNKVAESDWKKYNWSYVLTEMLYDGHIYGTGLGSMLYDPEAENNMGAVQFRSTDPFQCFPDPEALDVNVRSGYFIQAEPLEVSTVKAEYPDKAQYIKSDITDFVTQDKASVDQVRYKSPMDNVGYVESTAAYNMGTAKKCLKITCYMNDESTYDEVEKDELGQETATEKMKYPRGRKIVIASGVLCEDGPIPFDDLNFPYGAWRNYIMPREFWGMSEVEQVKGPQKVFNKLISFALDVLTLMGNPIWVVDDTADIDTDNLFNSPGLVVEKAAGSEVRRETGVQLQPYVMQLAESIRGYIDGLTGSTDISRGVEAGGITAASAITELQQAAQTRLRQKSRNLDATLQNFGNMYKSRVFQFYSAPRIFRLTNNKGANDFFKLHIEDRQMPDGTTQKVARVKKFNYNDEKRQYFEGPEKEYIIRGDFDVISTTGSGLPFAKSERETTAFKLFENQVIDDEELLKALDYPNYEAVLARMNEKRQQAAAQAPPQQSK